MKCFFGRARICFSFLPSIETITNMSTSINLCARTFASLPCLCSCYLFHFFFIISAIFSFFSARVTFTKISTSSIVNLGSRFHAAYLTTTTPCGGCHGPVITNFK
jgi:hypothetical protein